MKTKIIEPTEKYPIPNEVMVAQKAQSYLKMTTAQRVTFQPHIQSVHWKQEHYNGGPVWLSTDVKVWDDFFKEESNLTIKYSEAWITEGEAERFAKTLGVPFETH